MRNEHGLTPQQEAFAVALAAGARQNEAFRAAYPRHRRSEKGLCEAASRLAAKPEVRARVDGLLANAVKVHEDVIARLNAEWSAIGYADARELTELRRNCCRYCWGLGFRYQRTAAEREGAYADWLKLSPKQKAKLGQLEFDERGGIGFHKHRAPNSECPECFGDGELDVFFKDTRRVSPAAARLYAGAKLTDKGMEVKLRSQDGALENLARAAGAYERDNRQKSDPLVALLKDLGGNVFAPVAGAALPGEAAEGDDDD